MANDSNSSKLGATLWPLITGLAVGFLAGRETAGGGARSVESAEAAAPAAAAAKAPAGTKMPDRIYKSQSEFPADWVKEADLASVTTVSFAGLSDAQKTTALQAINERDCQ